VVVAYVDDFQTLHLARLLANGRFDSSFGGDGKVSVFCDCRGIDPEIRIDDERILFVGSRTETTPSFPASPSFQQRVLIARLAPGGRLDHSFGNAGWQRKILVEAEPPAAILVQGNGSIVLAGARSCCDSPEGIYLLRIDPRAIDGRFARRSRATLRGLHLSAALRPKNVGAILPRAGGELDVLGSTDADGFVLRLRRDGLIDRRFAGDGFRHVRWGIGNAARTRDGRAFAVGSEFVPPAFALLRSGRLDRSFADGDPILLEDWSPSNLTLAMQRGRRPLLFDPGIETCRGSCPDRPKLMRFTALEPRAP
jgi:hypothetical protein